MTAFEPGDRVIVHLGDESRYDDQRGTFIEILKNGLAHVVMDDEDLHDFPRSYTGDKPDRCQFYPENLSPDEYVINELEVLA